MDDNTLHVHVILTVKQKFYRQNNLDAVKKITYNSGARFSKHLKPSLYGTYENLRLKMVSETVTRSYRTDFNLIKCAHPQLYPLSAANVMVLENQVGYEHSSKQRTFLTIGR